MNLVERFPSSVDPTKLSNTVKGLIISFSSIIILISSVYLHTSVSEMQIASFADQVAQTISAVGVAIGLIHTLYGVVIKVLNRFLNSGTQTSIDKNTP